MEYLILAMAFFAILHFVYESIIAPTLRAKSRSGLLSLRAELNEMVKTEPGFATSKAYHHLSDSLDAILKNIYTMEILTFVRMLQKVKDDPNLRKRLAERSAVLDGLPAGRIKVIRDGSISIAIRSLRYNGYGWSFYVVPMVAAGACLTFLRDRIKSMLLLTYSEINRLGKDSVPPPKLA
jgi:hypothetical protein